MTMGTGIAAMSMRDMITSTGIAAMTMRNMRSMGIATAIMIMRITSIAVMITRDMRSMGTAIVIINMRNMGTAVTIMSMRDMSTAIAIMTMRDMTTTIMRMKFSQAGGLRHRRCIRKRRLRIFWRSLTVKKSTVLCCARRAWLPTRRAAGFILIMCRKRVMSETADQV